MALTFRQAGDADWPAIERFVGATYGEGAHFKHYARWRWQLADNPCRTSPTGVEQWIAVARDEVVGQIALQAGRLHCDALTMPAYWIVDVMVRPDWRGKRVSHGIHDAILADRDVLVTLTMAEATRRIAMRAGAIELPPVFQLFRAHALKGRTVADFLAPRLQAGRVRRGVRTMIGTSAALPALAAFAANRTTRPIRVTGAVAGCERLPPDYDAIANQPPGGTRGWFDRSSGWMDWRFQHVPDLAYHQAAMRDDGGDLLGHAVWRTPHDCEFPFGTLVDINARKGDPAVLSALASHAIAAMEPWCEGITAGASHPALLAIYRQLGFRKVKTHRPTVVVRDEGLRDAITAVGPHWHFSKADHDWDQIHPAH